MRPTTLYPLIVYLHLLLFVVWLGADIGVFVLSRHFVRWRDYTLDQRMVLLKLLVIIDMGPRSAWALMVPVSLSLLAVGHWWEMPPWILATAWIAGGAWLYLIWDSHLHDGTEWAARERQIEGALKWVLALFYLWLGVQSVLTGQPLALPWIAWKAVLFGLIFVAAIMIDVTFRPLAGQLARVATEGSTESSESPVQATVRRTGRWVWMVYLLVLSAAFFGTVKPTLPSLS